MTMELMSKNVEKIDLKEAMTLDDLYKIMQEHSDDLPGEFKLQKGLLGKSINFKVYMQAEPRVTVKDNTVTVRKMGSKTNDGSGGIPSIDYKNLKQSVKAVKDGGLGKSVTGGAEYFVNICNAMVDILEPYTN